MKKIYVVEVNYGDGWEPQVLIEAIPKDIESLTELFIEGCAEYITLHDIRYRRVKEEEILGLCLLGLDLYSKDD